MHGENEASLEENHDPGSNSDHPFALQGSLWAELKGSSSDLASVLTVFHPYLAPILFEYHRCIRA
jgi:hypothetical protein